MMLASVQDGTSPAMSCRKCVSIAWPWAVCMTSGWNCTPASPRETSSNAATGAPFVAAVTTKPGGGTVTASPWLIHTCWAAGNPRSSTPGSVTLSAVRPTSDPPVCATSPPSACVMAWKP